MDDQKVIGTEQFRSAVEMIGCIAVLINPILATGVQSESIGVWAGNYGYGPVGTVRLVERTDNGTTQYFISVE